MGEDLVASNGEIGPFIGDNVTEEGGVNNLAELVASLQIATVSAESQGENGCIAYNGNTNLVTGGLEVLENVRTVARPDTCKGAR